MPVAAQTTYYVDDDSTCTAACGGGWATAYQLLEDALGAASDGDAIKVGEGTYEPSGGCAPSCGGADRYATFAMVDGVEIYGGYAGIGGSPPDARNIAMYETILSGDLDGTTHAYTVVTAAYTVTETALLDGFTISGGRADVAGNCSADSKSPLRHGGGFHTDEGTPIVRNCTFTDNEAICRGGGAFVIGPNDYDEEENVGAPRFEHCVFYDNTAIESGGELQSARCPIYVGDTLFIDNSSTGTGNDDGGGGAEFGPFTRNAVVERCVFASNTSGRYGGGFGITDYGSHGEMVNCLFYGNVADNGSGGGAGGAYWGVGYMTLTGCTFAMNGCTGENLGGAIYIAQDPTATTTLKNCILWDNWTDTSTTTPTTEEDQVYRTAGTLSGLNNCVQAWEGMSGYFPDGSNNGDDPHFDAPANFDFSLNPSNCGGGFCDSHCIDRGEDDYTYCEGSDLNPEHDRCVNLDDLDDDVDMGALETQE